MVSWLDVGGVMIKLLLALVPLILLVGALYVVVKVLEAKGLIGKRGDTPSADPLPETPPDGPLPYVAKGGLLSDAELRFAAALEKAIAQVWPNQARIMVQVPVSCLIQVRPGLSSSEQTRWRNKIDRKTIDFVIVDHRLRPIVAIELDDSSHAAERRQPRDAFLEQAMEAAGVRLERVEGRAAYEAAAIASLLDRSDREFDRHGSTATSTQRQR